jgi:flagellin
MGSIVTNISAMTAGRYLEGHMNKMKQSLARLSSGYRINSAADDPAGLAVATRLRCQISSYNQAIKNVGSQIDILATAEGTMGELSNLVIRMRELSVEAASDGITDKERGYLDVEYQSLKEEIDQISGTCEFNGIKLLDGSLKSIGLEFQTGINNKPDDRSEVKIDEMSATGLKLADTKISDKASAREAMKSLDEGLDLLNRARAKAGAQQIGAEAHLSYLQTVLTNTTAAHSRIMDTDIASEMAEFSKHQILAQAATSMLAQANSLPKMLLSLYPQ